MMFTQKKIDPRQCFNSGWKYLHEEYHKKNINEFSAEHFNLINQALDELKSGYYCNEQDYKNRFRCRKLYLDTIKNLLEKNQIDFIHATHRLNREELLNQFNLLYSQCSENCSSSQKRDMINALLSLTKTDPATYLHWEKQLQLLNSKRIAQFC